MILLSWSLSIKLNFFDLNSVTNSSILLLNKWSRIDSEQRTGIDRHAWRPRSRESVPDLPKTGAGMYDPVTGRFLSYPLLHERLFTTE